MPPARLNLCALLLLAVCLLAPTGALAAITVQVLIDMRAEIAARRFDPAVDSVGVRGSLAPLAWDRSVQAAPASGHGWYRLTLRFDAAPFGGQPVAYKFKVDRPGDAGGGWETGRNHPLLLQGPDARIERAFNAAPRAMPLSRTGTIERLAAPQGRAVQVWLPPGYAEDPARRYPVLYLHDGQNVFDADAAGAEWQLDETAQRLMAAGAVRPVIFVALEQGPQRLDDCTPDAMQRDGRAQGGGIERHASYLVGQLKPFIDARYRTLSAPAHTAAGGSSVCGLAVVWLLLHQAQTFGAGLVVSPAVWWADEAVLRDVAATRLQVPPRLWLDIGLLEGNEAVQGARKLRHALTEAGWSPAYTEQAHGMHDEASWASRVEGMLRFLYAPR